MAIDPKALETTIDIINDQLNLLVNARDDLRALIRIDSSINDKTTADQVVNDSKVKLKMAAQGLIDLLNAP